MGNVKEFDSILDAFNWLAGQAELGRVWGLVGMKTRDKGPVVFWQDPDGQVHAAPDRMARPEAADVRR